MAMIGVALVFAGVLCWVAVRANRRFSDKDRLPMQWWLDGEVTWSAPRRVALGFIPAVAIGLLAADVAMARVLTPRPGQEGLVLPVLIGLGMPFVAVQLFHLWMIDRSRRRDG